MHVKVSDETGNGWNNLPSYEYRVGLNPRLILRQGIDQKAIGEVFATHGEKCSLFNRATSMLRVFADKGEMDNLDHIECSKINKELETLEYRAQIAWGFEENVSFHNWWLELPGCQCPQMDNRERIGVTESRIYSGGCPWHGWFDSKREEI